MSAQLQGGTGPDQLLAGFSSRPPVTHLLGATRHPLVDPQPGGPAADRQIPHHHLPAAMPDRPDPGVGTADPISPGLDTDLNLVIDVDRPSTKMSIPSMTTAAPKPDSSPWGLLIISLALDSSRISRGPSPSGRNPPGRWGSHTLRCEDPPKGLTAHDRQ